MEAKLGLFKSSGLLNIGTNGLACLPKHARQILRAILGIEPGLFEWKANAVPLSHGRYRGYVELSSGMEGGQQ